MTNEYGSGIDSTDWDRPAGFAGIGSREAHEIIGNTDAHTYREHVAQSEAQAERRRAEYDRARASGIGVWPHLDNELGRRLADGPLAGIKRNAAAAKKVQSRLDEEFEHLMSLAAGQRDPELLGAAWEAAQAKAKVPAIMLPAEEFDQSTRLVNHPMRRREDLLERMRLHWASENRETVLAEWVEIEQVIGEESTAVLDEAPRVYWILVDATGVVDNADLVIENGQPEVLDAFKTWPTLVQKWEDVQSVRQWLTVAAENGFDEKAPDRLIRTGAQMIEREVWRSQFVGHEIDADTPAEALQWYAERMTTNNETAEVNA
ncbi:hypothetical protein ACIGGF_01240 [Rhodococcus sp. NPDC078407]|uniref:hypothetical protein n=1 Tax=Rhodococcus sp. NPDC078407 TaxID=3364509 RepID=UPI0037CAD4FA